MALTLHQSGHGHSHGGLSSQGHGHDHDHSHKQEKQHSHISKHGHSHDGVIDLEQKGAHQGKFPECKGKVHHFLSGELSATAFVHPHKSVWIHPKLNLKQFLDQYNANRGI